MEENEAVMTQRYQIINMISDIIIIVYVRVMHSFTLNYGYRNIGHIQLDSVTTFKHSVVCTKINNQAFVFMYRSPANKRTMCLFN